MMGKVLRFVPADAPFPADRTSERTGVHRCVICMNPVESVEYFRNDQACDRCASSDSTPFAGGDSTGFSPIDREDVRTEIARRK